jgi:hypothetical protein
MAYYDFLLNQWKLCKLTEEQVANAVMKGYLTQQEADAIVATPRNCE